MSISLDENTIEFWKRKYEELNVQFDEYQKSSRDFEQELENELKQKEDENKALKSQNNRLQTDNESLKNKVSEMNVSTHKQIATLQEELAKIKAVRDEMQKYIRELEQKNDDLERTNRCVMFSLAEFESKLNEALERNAILECELDEKDELVETVQRLRDEARDLKQDLNLKQGMHQNPVTSSVRVPVLNLVGDALKKVTSMETRLIATRNQIKESNRDRRISIDSANCKMSKTTPNSDDGGTSNADSMMNSAASNQS